jgi:hypothetical protein
MDGAACAGQDGRVAARTMTWDEVSGRLADARSYWAVTVGTNGAPLAAPVWGAVVDGVLYMYTERTTAKARALAVDPRIVVHLESAEDVLIVHGQAEDLGRPSAHPAVIAALEVKYSDPADQLYLPSADEAFDVLYAIRPQRARAWRLGDWDGSQARWMANPG